MALSATIYRCALQISDLDRAYYADHTLTIARHPSETEERMMVRLLAFSLHADDDLAFTRGLSQDDEPDLWQRALNGDIELWIELGQPDEKRLRKACSRAKHVVVYGYQTRAAEVWWQNQCTKLAQISNLGVKRLPLDIGKQLETMARRNMALQCTIQDNEVWLSDEQMTLNFGLETLQ